MGGLPRDTPSSFLFACEHLTLQEIRNFPVPNLCSLYFQTLLAPAQGK